MTTYIQRRTSPREVETVDEFKTTKEARAMVREYRMGDPSAEYYTSSRACREWREASRKQARTEGGGT